MGGAVGEIDLFTPKLFFEAVLESGVKQRFRMRQRQRWAVGEAAREFHRFAGEFAGRDEAIDEAECISPLGRESLAK